MLQSNLNVYIKFYTLQKTGVIINQSVEWLEDRQNELGSDPAGLKEFLSPPTSKPRLFPTHHPIKWVFRGSFLDIKRPGRESDQSPSYSAEIKNYRSYNFAFRYAFIACVVKKLHLVLPAHCIPT